MVLTAAMEEDAVVEAVAAGAAGYLQKYSGKEKFLSAVRDVVDGEHRIPAHVIRRVFAELRSSAQQVRTSNPGRLSQREREILALFAQGLS